MDERYSKEGWHRTKNGRGFISHFEFVTIVGEKEGVDPLFLYNALAKYENDIRGPLPNHVKRIHLCRVHNESDFTPFTGRYLYKYLKAKDVDRFMSGSIRLGVIEDFRNYEGQIWKDHSEGKTLINIKGKDRAFMSWITGGLNNYIFCATDLEKPTKKLKKTFGDSIVRIDLQLFIDIVIKQIKAKGVTVRKIQYDDGKTFEVNVPELVVDSKDLSNVHMRLFDDIMKASEFSAVFMKPTCFSDENEVRIAFEMDKNVSEPIILNVPELVKTFTVMPHTISWHRRMLQNFRSWYSFK